MTRTFIAICLPDAVRAALASRMAALTPRLPPGVRWVAPESLHLTLAFLGELDGARLAQAEAATAVAAREGVPFALRLTHLGTFGPPRAPKVIWAGVTGDSERLRDLQDRLASELALRGFPREDRPFSPHLTLARIKAPLPPEVARTLPELLRSAPEEAADDATWRVREICVMRSERLRSGAVYTCLKTCALGE
jgi:2'-5' RNA ligase